MSLANTVAGAATFSTLTDANTMGVLPSWLQLDHSSHILSGTPLNSVRGFYYLALTATSSLGSFTQVCAPLCFLRVTPACWLVSLLLGTASPVASNRLSLLVSMSLKLVAGNRVPYRL